VAVVPYPDPQYFWGASYVEALTPLQAWREQRMNDIDELLGLNLDPPRSASGMMGITEEKLLALRKRGSVLFSATPGGEIKEHRPQLPPDAFAEIQQIDAMFGEQAGLPNILAGGGNDAMRSGGQASTLATMASGRVRKRALVIEDLLEQLATKLIRLERESNDTVYHTPDKQEFLLRQKIPASVEARVSAHTASPIYAEQLAAKADRLLKAGAIDLPTYVELLDPPMVEQLREKARLLQESKGELAKARLEIERTKASRPRGR
jgi:hypothetical protein